MSSLALGFIVLVSLAAFVACDADAQVSPQSTDAEAASAAALNSAVVNSTAECLPGFERHVRTGDCFQPPTCFLPMELSDERDTCICTTCPQTLPLCHVHLYLALFCAGPASEPTHKDYWGGFRVINGMWCAHPSSQPFILVQFCFGLIRGASMTF